MIAQVLTAVAATLASSPPPNLPGFLNVVAPYLDHYSYWAVLLLVMLEDFGIPVPGETILIAAAIFAGAGRLNVVVVGLVGFVAAVIGDNIGFAIGHFGGRALALRWGKYVFLTEERLAKAEYFFDHHGARIIVVARFIEGLRQANGIIAGISGMHWRRFVVFNALGAALWVGTWVTLGYVAGNHIGTIYHYVNEYSLYALIAAVVLAATFIIWHVVRRRRGVTHRAAREPQENPAPSSSAGLHEEPEAIERHGAQEAEVIQETAGTQEDTGTGKAAETEEAAGIQDGATTPDSVGAGAAAGAQPGAGTQPGAGAQPAARIQNGSGIQESAKTQSS